MTRSNFSRREFIKVSGAAFASVMVSDIQNRLFEIVPEVHQNYDTAFDKPDVLLIVLDTVRAQNLSLYGYSRPTTPNLDVLSERGTLFEKAFSTAPWTLPSHASMFTGRYMHETGVDWLVPLDSTYPTLAEVFQNHGYQTAGFIANMQYCSQETGLARGFQHYEDHFASIDKILFSPSIVKALLKNQKFRAAIGYQEIPGRKTANKLINDFLGWLSRQGSQPFFAFLNFYDAHNPYLPPEPFDELFGPKIPRRNPHLLPGWDWTQQDIQAELDAYDGAIAFLDLQLNRLFDELEVLGRLDNTLIIITSDHGEQFGEHGLMEHSNSLYLPTLHVPLLFIYPQKVPGGRRISNPVTLRDLPTTIVDIIGLEDGAIFPGKSLSNFWNSLQGEQSNRFEPLLSEVNYGSGLPEWYPISKGDMKSLIDDRYHYIKNGDGHEELYDLESDPTEEYNIVRTVEEDVLLEFRASLDSVLNHG